MTGDAQLKPYESWTDFAQNLKNPISIINFIAAYGTHATLITGRDDARGQARCRHATAGPRRRCRRRRRRLPADRLDFLNRTGAWTPHDDSSAASTTSIFWIGGLAEKKMAFGGMLGSTFNFVFETQMENLQNGDRFYYLSRTQGINLLNELEPNYVRRTGDAQHRPRRSALDASVRRRFSTRQTYILELDTLVAQNNPASAPADPTWDDPFLQASIPKVVRIRDDRRRRRRRRLDGNISASSPAASTSCSAAPKATTRLIGDKASIRSGATAATTPRTPARVRPGVRRRRRRHHRAIRFGDDFLRGNEGNDVITAVTGLDLLFGGEGNDFIIVGTDTTRSSPARQRLHPRRHGCRRPDGQRGRRLDRGRRRLRRPGRRELRAVLQLAHHRPRRSQRPGQRHRLRRRVRRRHHVPGRRHPAQQRHGSASTGRSTRATRTRANSDLGIPIFDNQQAFILRDRFDSSKACRAGSTTTS